MSPFQNEYSNERLQSLPSFSVLNELSEESKLQSMPAIKSFLAPFTPRFQMREELQMFIGNDRTGAITEWTRIQNEKLRELDEEAEFKRLNGNQGVFGGDSGHPQLSGGIDLVYEKHISDIQKVMGEGLLEHQFNITPSNL
jgi:hypothetical protein